MRADAGRQRGPSRDASRDTFVAALVPASGDLRSRLGGQPGAWAHPEEPWPLCSQHARPHRTPVRTREGNQHPRPSAESRGERAAGQTSQHLHSRQG